MAGTTNGRAPASFRTPTSVRTTSARFVMPRLPTPMATVAPGWIRPRTPMRASSAATVPATSSTRGASKRWRTSSILG